MRVRCVISLLLLLGLGLADPAPAAAQARSPEPKALRVEPLVDTLENGLRAVVLEHRTAPNVTVQAWVNAGSTTEDEHMGAGLSHFLEHMLFKGTARRDAAELGRDVKAIGGFTNAYTSFDRTVYYVNCASSGVNEALDILTDVLNHATFAPEEIERERTVIVKEMNLGRDDPAAWAGRLLFQLAFLEHPYRHPVIGYEDVLKSVTRDDLVAYYRRFYVPNNITLIVAGDIDAPAVLAEITRLWEGIPRQSVPLSVRPPEPMQLSPREHLEERDAEMAHVQMGFHGPALSDPDLFAIDVLSLILGGGRTSRLYRAVREQQALVHHIASFSYTPRDPGLFGIAFRADVDKRERATAAVLSEVARVQERGITRRELDTAKRKVLANYYEGRQTAEQWAESLGTGLLLAGDVQFDERYVAGVHSVTTADVQRVARKYLTENNRTVVTVVPPGGGPSPTAAAAAAEVAPPVVRTLENGVRVLIRENHTVPLVSLRAAVLGGVRSEDADVAGISALMAALLPKGTRRWNAEDLAGVVESRGGRVSAFSGYNSWGVQVDMLAADLPMAVEVLQEVLVHPTFPDAAVAREREIALANIQAEQEDPTTIASRLLRRAMYEDHPYRWLPAGTPEAVRALTPADFRQYHHHVLDPQRMVVAVAGDIEPEAVTSALARALGELVVPEDLWTPPPVPQFAARDAAVVSQAQPTVQTILMVAFPGVRITDARTTDLDVIATASNGVGGRLFHRLRDERGLAYTVGFWSEPGVDPGMLVFYIATVPDQRTAALEGLWDEIERLRREGLSEREIADARLVLRSDQARELETNGSFAFVTALHELYGLGATHYQGLPERLARVTPETTRAVAAELFDRSRAVVVEVGPANSSAN